MFKVKIQTQFPDGSEKQTTGHKCVFVIIDEAENTNDKIIGHCGLMGEWTSEELTEAMLRVNETLVGAILEIKEGA